MNDEEKKIEAERQEAEKRAAEAKAAANANSDNGKKIEEKVVSDAKEMVEGMKKENKKKGELLEREEKLQTRKETLNALGGNSPAGTNEPQKNLTDEEKASNARIKQIADASDSDWGKKYE